MTAAEGVSARTIESTAAAAVPARRGYGDARTVWGLDARAVHDAYWAARGVQVVRCGRPCALEAAELFLLIDDRSDVLFDIARISSRLMWHNALVTRLRLIDDGADDYDERVRLDADGCVERIERRYDVAGARVHHVVLTTRRRLAEIWSAASDRRSGWRAVRRAVAWPRVDHGRLPGAVYRRDDADAEIRLIRDIVDRWPRPDQAIEGVEEISPGVWALQGEPGPAGAVLIGPIWIGQDSSDVVPRCLVGPRWIGDAAEPGGSGATVRPIAEVTIAESRGADGVTSASQLYPIAKRVMDIVVSAIGLLALAPLLAIIATLIVLEDGRPVLFGHRRQGRGGRGFTCWKFRTMHRNAEAIARELEAYNVCDGPQVYIREDPRVTRLGRVLRTTHLDELPQLWNVLVGEMSLVSPRPSPIDENQFCPAWRDSRLSVRPGITGLWQLRRRRAPGEDFQEWIRYDIEYVLRAGLRLDLRIMFETIRIVVLGRDNRAKD